MQWKPFRLYELSEFVSAASHSGWILKQLWYSWRIECTCKFKSVKKFFFYKIHTFHAYGDLSTQCLTRASNKVAQSKGKAKAKEKSITNFRSKMTDETNFCKEIDNNKNKNSVRCQFCNSIILKPNSANYSENEVNVVCVRAYVYDTALVTPNPNFHTGTNSMCVLLFSHSFES